MCKAIDDMRQESWNEGFQEGFQEGFIETLSGMVKEGVLPLTDAAKRMGLSPAEFQKKASELSAK